MNGTFYNHLYDPLMNNLKIASHFQQLMVPSSALNAGVDFFCWSCCEGRLVHKLAVGADALLKAKQLPGGLAHLAARLPNVQRDTLAHDQFCPLVSSHKVYIKVLFALAVNWLNLVVWRIFSNWFGGFLYVYTSQSPALSCFKNANSGIAVSVQLVLLILIVLSTL